MELKEGFSESRDWEKNNDAIFKKLLEYFQKKMGGFEEEELDKPYDYLRETWNDKTNATFIVGILEFLRKEHPELEEFQKDVISEEGLEILDRLLAHEKQDSLRTVFKKFSTRLARLAEEHKS